MVSLPTVTGAATVPAEVTEILIALQLTLVNLKPLLVNIRGAYQPLKQVPTSIAASVTVAQVCGVPVIEVGIHRGISLHRWKSCRDELVFNDDLGISI